MNTTITGVIATAVFAAAALAGCGGAPADATAPSTPEFQVQALGTGPAQDTGKPISDAVCNDLGANGMSMFQLKASAGELTAMSGEEYAGFLYGHLAEGCPALLQDESVRGFLTSWNVNPDA